MRKEYDIKKLKVKRRGILPELSDADDSPTKVRITISLDKDIVDYFKAEAKHPGALPYQTQINRALREMICTWHLSCHDDFKQELLNDPVFIKQMAKKVKQIT
jgi:uncharacterized protein (DUF4415 family)